VTAAHRHLAYVPADVALWPGLTGAEIRTLLARLGPGTDEAYRRELVDRFSLEPDRRALTYSTGNRQKVDLVAAFATRAPLLVFDEPTIGLDPLMERRFQECVAEAATRGQTVFLSSHQLAEVEKVCDRVGILLAVRYQVLHLVRWDLYGGQVRAVATAIPGREGKAWHGSWSEMPWNAAASAFGGGANAAVVAGRGHWRRLRGSS
jgi:ABC-type nitrate/sulfonate/bicarbonate transport system ATPase subunit